MSPLRPRTWLPARLATRFALAAAASAALALLLTSIASWWLINQQHRRAMQELTLHEMQFRAASVSNDLNALAARMSEIASSTILATALVDSAGRETYLLPFLSGIRQINGLQVQMMLTDFEGRGIASNGRDAFDASQRAWLKEVLPKGQPAARIFGSGTGAELVAVEPMTYARTASPEGAVFYKIALESLDAGGITRPLRWGPPAVAQGSQPQATSVPVRVAKVFEPLQLRIEREHASEGAPQLGLPFLHVLLIGAAIFGIVVAVGMRLTQLVTKDLRELEAFSRGVMGSTISRERAPTEGSAEVASVARSINDMLDRLSTQHAALLQEREKLTRLTQALQAADQKKDDFLAMLGHELRNPLSPIASSAYLLARLAGQSGDPKIAQLSEIIIRQTGHMTKLINDLLDVSRVTRGRITLTKTVLDMSAVVHAAIEQMRPLMESCRHQLSVTAMEEPLHVLGDHARLVQVISNILNNAAKYTPEGGRIALTLQAEQAEVMVSVQDNGVGISADLISQVFEPFTQEERSVDRSQGGLGLGLALVKSLVDLHGGRVEAASDGIGHGSVFTLRLPRVEGCGDKSSKPASSGARSASPATRLSILVVDDNVDAAQTLCDWLQAEGHSVWTAHSGQEALDLVRNLAIDAFLLDIGLPGMDGLELARRLRSLPQSADALMIALTGYGQAADRQRSVDAGFDEHLVKPADPDTIHACLQRWCENALSNP